MCCVYVYKPLEFYSFSFSIVTELFLAQLAAAHSHSPLTREHESFHSLKNNVEVPTCVKCRPNFTFCCVFRELMLATNYHCC